MKSRLLSTFDRLVLIFIVAAAPTTLKAQAVASAQVSGYVTDASGAAVPNAKVVATQTETGMVRTGVSATDGSYILPNLQVGPYSLEATASGFDRYLQTGITLVVGDSVSANISLRVGSSAQEVQVVANVGMVETRDTAVSQVLDQESVLDLPMDGRQATDLLLLSGASADASSFGDLVSTKNYGSADIGGSVAISVAGGQANGTNYMLDGGDNNHGYSNINLPFPFPDAIQEFSVQTNGLSARLGLHPGATMNVITKSGSNRYHGDLFEFFRNGKLNARNFFAPARDSLKRNQFGGTVGGPIRKDKLMFFLGYQGTRIRTAPKTTTSYVPTAAVDQGDFSQINAAGCQSNGKAKTINDPSTGQAFANNLIPVSRFSPQAVALLKYIPVSSDPCGKLNYAIPNPEDEDQIIGRVDYIRSEKHAIFGRYFTAHLQNPPVPFNNNLLTTTRAGLGDRSQSVVIGDSYSFSPTMLNALHLTGTRLDVRRYVAPDGVGPSAIGVNMTTNAPNYLYTSVSGFFSTGGTAPARYPDNLLQVADDLDLIRGHHHLSVGFDWIYSQLNYNNLFYGNGYFGFGTTFTGSALADFLLGRVATFTAANPAASDPRQQYIGSYVQDDITLSSRLQLHLGVRWEPFLPAADKFNRIDHLDPAAFASGTTSKFYNASPAGLLFVGDKGIPASFAQHKLADFEPRIGVAWDPNGKGQQSIRASYSNFYDLPELNYASHPSQSAPWGNTITLTSPAGGFANPWQGYPGGNPFPTHLPPSPTQVFPTGGAYINVAVNTRPTYVQAWNTSYQRQLGRNWLLSATYLGSKTTHLWIGTEQDPAVYIPGTCAGKACSSTSNTAQRRVLYLQNAQQGAYYSTIAETDDGANANYNGLLLTARHRFTRNYSVLANYTYSHCISEGNFVNALTGPSYQNPANRDADRGNCAFDLRHSVNLAFVAMAPRFQGKWTNRVFSNWRLSPIVSRRTGTWFSPTSGIDNSLTGVGLDRPNVVGADYSTSGGLHYLNPGGFKVNPIGTFGNAGAFSLQGPARINVNIGAARIFKVREGHRLEVRFEAFNAVNHANFNNPVANVSSSQFGLVQTAASPRILQIAMKYVF